MAPEQDHDAQEGDSPNKDGKKQDADKDQDSEAKEKEQTPEEKAAAKRKKLKIFIILGIVLLILAIGGFIYWLHARHYEATDDAFIDGHIAQVAPQISGRVTRLLVDDNQVVKEGNVLFTIDPRDYDAKLAQAKAQLETAHAKADEANAQIAMQQANQAQAEANLLSAESDQLKAKQDLKRYQDVDKRAIAKTQMDEAVNVVKTANARVEAMRQMAVSAAAQVEASKAQEAAAQAAVHQGEADVAAAELQRSYTDVKAPQDGRVTRRTVELGNYMVPGQPVMAIVSQNIWVTANFKETQLTDMRIGQPVEIDVDSYPDAEISGHVDSLQAGTGAVFSSLPAENATGNFVKIVQRVPVKIVIDKIKFKDNKDNKDDKNNKDRKDRSKHLPLAPGLSANPRVKVR